MASWFIEMGILRMQMEVAHKPYDIRFIPSYCIYGISNIVFSQSLTYRF